MLERHSRLRRPSETVELIELRLAIGRTVLSVPTTGTVWYSNRQRPCAHCCGVSSRHGGRWGWPLSRDLNRRISFKIALMYVMAMLDRIFRARTGEFRMRMSCRRSGPGRGMWGMRRLSEPCKEGVRIRTGPWTTTNHDLSSAQGVTLSQHNIYGRSIWSTTRTTKDEVWTLLAATRERRARIVDDITLDVTVHAGKLF